MIEECNESRIKIKKEVQLQTEKEAFKNLMMSINNMGGIPPEKFNYKYYHQVWSVLVDRMRIYKRTAKLDEKYGLDKEV